MTYGVTDSGFVKKTQSNIESTMESYIQSNYYSAFKLRREADKAEDQLLSTVARELSDVWEVAESLYYAKIPSYAEGVQLDNVCEYNHVERLTGVKTVVTATFTGTSGTIIPEGSTISITGTSYKFDTQEEITIPAGGSIDSSVIAQEYGAISVIAGTLTVIETPVAGWATVTNASSETTTGRDEETDSELRIRRELLLARTGKASEEAINSNVRNVDNVVDCYTHSNRTNSTDANGLPAKSFECVVYGGTDSDVGDKIWDVMPAGIESYGTTSQSVTDSTGRTQTVEFTRPTEIPIYIDIEIEKTSAYPTDGDTQIKTALVNYITNTLLIGDDVIRTKLYSYIYGIAGITNVSSLLLSGGTSSGESASDVTIEYNEISTCSSDYITITYA